MDISGLLVLHCYIVSCIADTIDIIYPSAIDSVCRECDFYQGMTSYKESRQQAMTRSKLENIGNVRNEMKVEVQRNIENEDKRYALSQRCIYEYFPALNHCYHFPTRGQISSNKRLDIIKSSVTEEVTKGNLTELMKYCDEYKNLLALVGPNVRIYIQMADCMALIAQFTKRLDSEPMLNCALNLYNEILTIPEHSDDHCTIVARRCIAYLSLMGGFHSIIDIQQKLVDRSPQNVAELSKLGEMRYAVRNNLNPQDMFEKLLELDQYIGENLVSDQMF